MARWRSRATILAALMALPAILSAVGLSAIELYRSVQPDAPLFLEPPPASLKEAILGRHGAAPVYRFIRNGADPNEPIVVDDHDWTGGRPVRVTPLIAAVAAGDVTVVQMLMNFGARVDLPQNAQAWCFARERGDEAIADVIARDGYKGVPPSCPERLHDPAQPALAWLP